MESLSLFCFHFFPILVMEQWSTVEAQAVQLIVCFSYFSCLNDGLYTIVHGFIWNLDKRRRKREKKTFFRVNCLLFGSCDSNLIVCY